ncbi:SWIB/MDM2 domain-containing protein [Pyronema omphalodes]|nr:SWIB/MDM2 domain-containing protein [Pyronema omphalodes]
MSTLTLSQKDEEKFTPLIDDILRSSDLSTVSVKKIRNALAEQCGIDFTPLKKSIDALITSRFDAILAEREAASPSPEPAPSPSASPSPKASAEPESDSPSALGTSTSTPAKKRKSASGDEDARLAAELHAKLNGGRPSRGTTTKKVKKPAAKGKAKKKSKDTVESDTDGEKPEKKKRKVGANNAFMKPLILSAPLADFIGETQMSRPEVVKRIWAYVKENNLQDPQDKRYILCDQNMKPVFGDKVHML